jgi:3-hydroxy acid dehydrogenase/malonic semialdehyde reductase
MLIDEKIIWITGGRSGIGKAIAQSFAALGARVILSSRDADALKEVAHELGPQVHALPCDVTDAGQVQAAALRIFQDFGRVDILVNNAGSTVFKSFVETSVEEFDDLSTTNLRGPFLCSKAVLPAMLERGEGFIIMINSVAALNVFPNSSVYSATKGGLKMLADCLRAEVRAAGVRVVSIFPGATNTPIWPEKMRASHGHKMMSPGDVAEAVVASCMASPSVLYEEIIMQPVGGAI